VHVLRRLFVKFHLLVKRGLFDQFVAGLALGVQPLLFLKGLGLLSAILEPTCKVLIVEFCRVNHKFAVLLNQVGKPMIKRCYLRNLCRLHDNRQPLDFCRDRKVVISQSMRPYL
jgi:hypothetical protein